MAHHLDGRTSAVSNFLIRLRASGPWGMSVRTAELQHAISISAMRASRPWEAVVRTVEVESAISILVARASEPRLTDLRTGIFELRFLPYVDARPDGIRHRLDGRTIFSFSELGRIWDWSSTERRPDVLLKSPNGCKLDRTFSTQWRVRTEVHVVRTDDAWSD
jgi:hypothetical protein